MTGATADDLVREHHTMLVRIAMRAGLDPARAEECAQDAWVALLTRGHEVKPGAVPYWLGTVTRNRAISVWRRDRRQVPVDEVPDADGGGQDPADTVAGNDRVRRALGALPPGQRAVFAAIALGDAGYEDTARALGVTGGTVRHQLHSARRKLAAREGA